MNCKVSGCPNPIEPRLQRQALCLEHFVADIQDRCHRFARRLAEEDLSEVLQRESSQFVIFAAAKIASIGTDNPPSSQLMRGKLLNVILMLADLRERLDRTAAEVAAKPH
ncbi:MAG: hypothetical protein ACE5H2_08280 [Terriglobia bacterium]